MSISFLGIVLGASLGGGLFLYPLCSAFMAGIEAARDPSHRITPQSPWVVFDRTVRRRLTWWRGLWVVSYGAWVVILGALISRGQDQEIFHLFMLLSLLIFPPPLGPVFLGGSFCILWAPGCKSAGTLFAASFVAALSVFLVFLAVAAACMVFVGELVLLFVLPGIPLTSGAVLVWLWRRARRSGERWFRFED